MLLVGFTPAGAEDLRLDATANPAVLDVRLNAEGTLAGRVVTNQGSPVIGAMVQLQGRHPDPPRMASTDTEGCFAFAGLSTGLFQVTCDSIVQYVRIWSLESAPPAAVARLELMPSATPTVRGQQPLCNLFCNEPIMIGVLVAAAIAIPLALHDSGDEADGS
jgi:hypothetical protein